MWVKFPPGVQSISLRGIEYKATTVGTGVNYYLEADDALAWNIRDNFQGFALVSDPNLPAETIGMTLAEQLSAMTAERDHYKKLYEAVGPAQAEPHAHETDIEGNPKPAEPQPEPQEPKEPV